MNSTQDHSPIIKNVHFSQDDSGYLVFQFIGSVNVDTVKWTERKMLEVVSSNNLTYLVVLFDLSRYEKMDYAAREQANQSIILKQTKLDVVIYGLKPSKKASLQFLFNNDDHLLKLYLFNEFEQARHKSFELINGVKLHTISQLPSALTGVVREKVKVGSRVLDLFHDKNWVYNAPQANYFYKINLIDSNILVSKPSGVIEFENSINANVLFDKVIYEVLGHEANYYRIQDYTDVEKTSYSARRDFTNYIIRNIGRINLMVFHGLNSSMKAVVKIGKLVHPSFSKVKIAANQEEALDIILSHKYDPAISVNPSSIASNSHSNQNDFLSESQHEKELKEIFEQIGKILWAPNRLKDYKQTNSIYSEIYQALDVLKGDIDEIVAKKEKSIEEMHKQLFEFSEEIKKYRAEIRDINLKKKEFTKSLHYDIRTPVHSMLTLAELIQLNKNESDKKEYIKQLLESSKLLSSKMNNQTDRLQKMVNSNNVNSSVFNLNQYINNQISVFETVAQKKNLTLEYKAGLIEDYYIGDIEKIGQILDHLILNAIQNSTDSKIVIETDLLEHIITRQKIRISVKDNGYGLRNIEQDFVQKIFSGNTMESDMFLNYQFGNGLIICQRLVGLLGGDMVYENLEEGSHFGFEVTLDLGVFSRELNLLKRSSSLRYLHSSAIQDGSITVWKNSDESVDSDLLVISQLGVSAKVLNTESLLITYLSENESQLILVHYDSIEELEKKSKIVKKHSRNSQIKICGITTNIDLSLDGLLENKVLNYHMFKPYSIKKLVDIIKEALK